MKKAICIILCVSAVLAFASCKKGGEDVSTTAPSQSAVQEQTSSTAAPVQSSASSEEKTTQAEKAGEKTTEKSAEKTGVSSSKTVIVMVLLYVPVSKSFHLSLNPLIQHLVIFSTL